jgi:hypothetical protein
MLSVVIKSVSWIFRYTVLFLFILLVLVAGQGVVSIAGSWEKATSDPLLENPISALSQELQNTTPSNSQSSVCSAKVLTLSAQKKQLRIDHEILQEEYSNLYFYQIEEKLNLEIQTRKINGESQLIDQAISYLELCQVIGDNEEARRQCKEKKQKCSKKVRDCGLLEKSFPSQCNTLERLIPPWPKMCKSHQGNIDDCNTIKGWICKAKVSACALSNETVNVIGAFVPSVETASPTNSVTGFIEGLSKALDKSMSQSAAAFLILLSIIFSPLLINIIVFFGLSKLVEQSYKIRLNDAQSMSVTELARPDDLIEVALHDNRELLVKAEFIRNVPEELEACTKALLNFSLPLTSIASGLYMLTRFTTKAGSSTSVILSESNTSDTKLSIISLDENSEIVLSPRNIVGIVQDKDKPLQITSKWLISRPSAWLAGQIRVLVLKGESEIVIKGTRGIFLQKVQADSTYSCEGVIGYSTNLLLQPKRTETFWAFHRNKRELFKQRFSSAEGVVLQEKNPERKQVNISGWSLQRIGDIILKIFGV